ncbi:nucleotidyltransferase family protein [Shimia sp. R10_1]|uniref:nucleotidyltransferase family protein n=1 Tax=Shimia sp. R10_1 TaxID=2821095 RepID=UPI001ADB49CB|nr:nucleotidyltransferase family protein [Shimia sp. R10_1]MBO9472128.1 nucleotidyltransferase family protein [Shimia sp. R10_1]
MLTILVLAAGSSSRMRGGDKLLEDIEGAPLLRIITSRALATGANVMVALPLDKPNRMEALAGLSVQSVFVPDADNGMAHSLRAGVAALSDETTAVMILPADMPEIEEFDLQTMINALKATPEAILRGATAAQVPGHPVLFPRRFFPELLRLSGDKGARDVLKANKQSITLVPLPENHALVDLDTPEQWESWRAERHRT